MLLKSLASRIPTITGEYFVSPISKTASICETVNDLSVLNLARIQSPLTIAFRMIGCNSMAALASLSES